MSDLKFKAREDWEVNITFINPLFPNRVERVSGFSDSTELLKLYWYAKEGLDTYVEYIPLNQIKNVKLKSL